MSGYQYKATRIVNGTAVPPTQGRRLSDRIEAAFDQACDQGLTEIAGCMLKGLDLALLGRPQSWDRRQAALGVLRACHSRLEEMRRMEVAATTTGHEAEVLRSASAA